MPAPQPARRQLLRILRWLIFGAFSTVLIAWLAYLAHNTAPPWREHTGAFETWLDEDYQLRCRLQDPRGEIFLDVTSGLGYSWSGLVASWAEGVGQQPPAEWHEMFHSPQEMSAEEKAQFPSRDYRIPSWAAKPDDHPPRDLFSHAAGWPMRALACSIEHRVQSTLPSGRRVYTYTPRWGIPVPKLLSADTALPLRPLPLGFAIDTIFFAAAGWAAAWSFRAIRATLRRRRGRCPRCAYDLSATPPNSPCPECGLAARHTSQYHSSCRDPQTPNQSSRPPAAAG